MIARWQDGAEWDLPSLYDFSFRSPEWSRTEAQAGRDNAARGKVKAQAKPRQAKCRIQSRRRRPECCSGLYRQTDTPKATQLHQRSATQLITITITFAATTQQASTSLLFTKRLPQDKLIHLPPSHPTAYPSTCPGPSPHRPKRPPLPPPADCPAAAGAARAPGSTSRYLARSRIPMASSREKIHSSRSGASILLGDRG